MTEKEQEIKTETSEAETPVTHRQKVFSGALLLVFLITSFVIADKFNMHALQTYIEAHPSLTVGLSLLVFTLFSLTLIPSLPLIAFLALFIGPLRATVTAGVGMTFAALIEYFIGTQINNLVDMQRIRRRMPGKLKDVPVSSPIFLTLSRFLPTGPKPVNFLAGSLHISLFTYTWTALFTNFLGAAIAAYGATGLIKIPKL